jgi:uncharacterized protein (DUF488 family)
MAHRFFTIGHSTRSVGEFVDLLRPQEVKLVVDVRTIPRSRNNPQYNDAKLAKALSEFAIGLSISPSSGDSVARSEMCRRT